MTDAIFKSAITLILGFIICLTMQFYIPSAQWVGLIVFALALAYAVIPWYGNATKKGFVRTQPGQVSVALIVYTLILLFVGVGICTVGSWLPYIPVSIAGPLIEFFVGSIFALAKSSFSSLAEPSFPFALYTIVYGAYFIIAVCFLSVIGMWLCYAMGIELQEGTNFVIDSDTSNSHNKGTQYDHASRIPTVYDWHGQGAFDWEAVERWNASMDTVIDTLPLRGICSDGISLLSRNVPFGQLEAQGYYDIGSDANCDWVIQDSTVGSLHASLRMRNGAVYLKAISEHRPTKVANRVVPVGQAVGIPPNAIIEIGSVQIRVF